MRDFKEGAEMVMEGLDDMSDSTYTLGGGDKPLFFLKGEIKTPPFSESARREAGDLLDQLQKGKVLSMPQSRPMPVIGPRCHELRIPDAAANWRIICRVDEEAVLVVAIFDKKTRKTPWDVIDICKKRLRGYDHGS
jgi:phage-related protein